MDCGWCEQKIPEDVFTWHFSGKTFDTEDCMEQFVESELRKENGA